jgi:hypothetical protein
MTETLPTKPPLPPLRERLKPANLRNPKWVGNYMYGIARRAGDAFLYDFPSCFDLLASQGSANYQVEKSEHKSAYSLLPSDPAPAAIVREFGSGIESLEDSAMPLIANQQLSGE